MNKYTVTLSRTYYVSIIAENEEIAKECVEFFLDDCKDISSKKEKEEKQFEIYTIKPMLNEAIEIVKEL